MKLKLYTQDSDWSRKLTGGTVAGDIISFSCENQPNYKGKTGV